MVYCHHHHRVVSSGIEPDKQNKSVYYPFNYQSWTRFNKYGVIPLENENNSDQRSESQDRIRLPHNVKGIYIESALKWLLWYSFWKTINWQEICFFGYADVRIYELIMLALSIVL